MEASSWFVPFKQAIRSQSVPTALLNYGKLGDIIKHLALVKAVPVDDYSRFLAFKDGKAHIEKAIKKRLKKNGNKELNKALVYINVQTKLATRFQIYWADENQEYSEKRSSSIRIHSKKNTYNLCLADLKSIQRLRIDPADKPSELLLKSILIEQRGYEPIFLFMPAESKHLTILNNIQKVSVHQEGLSIVSSGNDPQLELYIRPTVQRIHTVLFPGKRQEGEYLYQANPGGASDLHSTRLIDEEDFIDGWPLLSIVTDTDNLYDPDIGILHNYEGHGKRWERLAYVSYYENKEVVFGTSAGLRLHGGEGRKKHTKFKSFRLYFRNEYGANQFKPGILFGPKTEPLKRLVVHHMDWPPGWPFNNLLAYDISKRIGCIVPPTKMVILYLNGELQGMYFLTTQLSRKQMEAYFGHDNFSLYRIRNDNDYDGYKMYIDILWRTTNSRDKLTMKEVDKSISVDNLSRWAFSIAFCGASDILQGVGVRDKSDPNSKLFWINWDMDQSFIDVSREIKKHNLKRPIWKQPAWFLVYKKRYSGRSRLFSRLMDEDPEYRSYFVSLVTDLLNHRVDADFLRSRLVYYKQALASYGEENSVYFDKLTRFFEHRAEFLRSQMQHFFGVGESLPCNVKGPLNIKYEIDGYPEDRDYYGWYFEGSSIRVEIVSPHRKNFSHWLVNGEKVAGMPLVYPINSETIIEPVLKKNTGNRV